MLLGQIDGPLFMLLLVSENTAKESTGVLIARFNNQSDRSFHATKFSKKQVVSMVK